MPVPKGLTLVYAPLKSPRSPTGLLDHKSIPINVRTFIFTSSKI